MKETMAAPKEGESLTGPPVHTSTSRRLLSRCLRQRYPRFQVNTGLCGHRVAYAEAVGKGHGAPGREATQLKGRVIDPVPGSVPG